MTALFPNAITGTPVQYPGEHGWWAPMLTTGRSSVQICHAMRTQTDRLLWLPVVVSDILQYSAETVVPEGTRHTVHGFTGLTIVDSWLRSTTHPVQASS